MPSLAGGRAIRRPKHQRHRNNRHRTNAPRHTKNRHPDRMSACGGARGIRTPDLLIANETRYQLRHSPKDLTIIAAEVRLAKRSPSKAPHAKLLRYTRIQRGLDIQDNCLVGDDFLGRTRILWHRASGDRARRNTRIHPGDSANIGIGMHDAPAQSSTHRIGRRRNGSRSPGATFHRCGDLFLDSRGHSLLRSGLRFSLKVFSEFLSRIRNLVRAQTFLLNALFRGI